jgi:hypothetical protein
MADLVVTSTTNSIRVTFNDASVHAKMSKGTWNKTRITFQLSQDDSYVRVLVIGEPAWAVSYDGVGGLKIDTVNGDVPTSNSDLYDKLTAIIQ